MKTPDKAGWLAIATAVLMLILSIATALLDGKITAEEQAEIGAKTTETINTIKTETAE